MSLQKSTRDKEQKKPNDEKLISESFKSTAFNPDCLASVNNHPSVISQLTANQLTTWYTKLCGKTQNVLKFFRVVSRGAASVCVGGGNTAASDLSICGDFAGKKN